MKYYSSRIRARKVRALAREMGVDSSKYGIIRSWMGYIHPEGHDEFSSSAYTAEMKRTLREFLNQ